MITLKSLATSRLVMSSVLLCLAACAGEVGSGPGGDEPEDFESDDIASSEDADEVGEVRQGLTGTLVGLPLDTIYKIVDADSCLGGVNNGKACTTNTDCTGGTCSLGAQRCVGGPTPNKLCTYTSQCGAGGTCYTQGTKLFNASTGQGSSLRMANHTDVKIVQHPVTTPPTPVPDVTKSAPLNGRYRVEHGSQTGTPTWGWVDAAALQLHHAANVAPNAVRTAALMRGRSAMGFSYWWGHGYWLKRGPTVSCDSNGKNCAPNAGKCVPNAGKTGCTGVNGIDCTHRATGTVEYGSDCSGFVSTVWGYQDDNPETEHANSGYSTAGFNKENPTRWSTVSTCSSATTCPTGSTTCQCFDKTRVIAGDAVVTSGHVYLVAVPRNSAGNIVSYECRGCNFGCMAWSQVAPDASITAKGIRRAGWSIAP